MTSHIWKAFYVICKCGHRNRPDRSARLGIRMALLDKLSPCKECGEVLSISETLMKSERPLVVKVRQELEEESFLNRKIAYAT